MSKIPTKWYVVGLKTCPYTDKAKHFLKSRGQPLTLFENKQTGFSESTK